MAKKKREAKFIVLSGEKMRERYNLSRANKPIIKLDRDKVPEKLQILIPLAEKFGVDDELIREDVLDNATIKEKKELRRVFRKLEDEVMEWLIPQSEKKILSKEYIAFSALLMAVDAI